MASLTSLIRTKAALSPVGEELNLDRGIVYAYTPGTITSPFTNNMCWRSPGTGTAIIEIWGAAGSGGGVCCCGLGMPANPPAYAKKTISVTGGSYVCGTVGYSCGNADAFNGTTFIGFRGCSTATNVCWCTSSETNGVICAQGGRGGEGRCLTAANQSTTSMFCLWLSAGYSGTSSGAGCGIICNHNTSTDWIPTATGGDINKNGGISCIRINHCNPCCVCCMRQYVTISDGMTAELGGQIEVQAEITPAAAQSGFSVSSFYSNLSGLNAKSPGNGMPFTYDHAGNKYCGCYVAVGCVPVVGTGTPGISGFPCTDQRAVGLRGGHGAVRIQYIPN